MLIEVTEINQPDRMTLLNTDHIIRMREAGDCTEILMEMPLGLVLVKGELQEFKKRYMKIVQEGARAEDGKTD